jgi:hypothetical protein
MLPSRISRRVESGDFAGLAGKPEGRTSQPIEARPGGRLRYAGGPLRIIRRWSSDVSPSGCVLRCRAEKPTAHSAEAGQRPGSRRITLRSSALRLIAEMIRMIAGWPASFLRVHRADRLRPVSKSDGTQALAPPTYIQRPGENAKVPYPARC